nr:alpha/beta fold hydrolase [Brevibacterium daeguense]
MWADDTAEAPAGSGPARTRSYRLPGLHVEEFSIPVPLDHFGDRPGSLEVFARVVGAPGSTKPFLLYLQGGPGVEAFRTTADSPPWLARALEDYRVVMLDQRGTGRSTPIGIVDGAVTGVPNALRTPPRSDAEADALAAHLTHYRADAIVEDAELVRQALGTRTWSVLGQSFGGFCTLRYLNSHPGSVAQAFFTGGLPAVGRTSAEQPTLTEVYERTWETMARKSRDFHRRFPQSRERLLALAERSAQGLELPDGSHAGPAHVRLLGHLLGASGGPERLHYLLDLDVDSASFRADFAAAQPYSARNPLYAVLHESCWANGVTSYWAAESAMPGEVREDPSLLAGEHVAQEIFRTGGLRAWEGVAHTLAAHDWPVLWEPSRLAAAEVPAAAIVYFDDAYVPREYSLATAELLPDVRVWVTNEYEHNGLRASGSAVLDRLIRMVRDEV